MVRGPLPLAARFEHLVRRDVPAELGRAPHMVEPPSAIVLRPVGRTIAPPGEAALGRGDESAPDVDPIVRLAQPRKGFDLDRRVADDGQKRLMAPDVAFERSDIEIADDDRRLPQPFRPARHPADEVELLAELGIDGAVGRVAASRNVDVLEPDAALEPDADMPRLAIVLPVVPAGVLQRHSAEDPHAMMYTLAVQLAVDVAVAVEQIEREDAVEHHGFLQAQDVGLLLTDQALDERNARANRVDVPRSDLQPFAHVARLARPEA